MVHLKVFVKDVEEHSLDALVQRGQRELIEHLRTMLRELEDEIVHDLEDDQPRVGGPRCVTTA